MKSTQTKCQHIFHQLCQKCQGLTGCVVIVLQHKVNIQKNKNVTSLEEKQYIKAKNMRLVQVETALVNVNC